MQDALTYRYPRTLDEAFGLDADSANPVEGPFVNPSRGDSLTTTSSLLALGTLLIFMAIGWVK